MLSGSPRALALKALRVAGFAALAEALTQRDLRILCYHGFSLRDEHVFRPRLFNTAEELERRLAYLQRGRYNVLPLDEALRRARAGTLPPRSVAITIDDGFYGTLSIAAPMLQAFGMPSTLYLATYHVVHQLPIFNLTAAYLLWRSTREVVDLSGLGMSGLSETRIRLRAMAAADREALAGSIIAHAETMSREERTRLLATLAWETGVSLEDIERERLFHLVSVDEAREIQKYGVSLDLHTHRHRSSGERVLVQRDLIANQAVLELITGRRHTHFCYPSGRVDLWQDAWLRDLGIESATTCHPGFVRADAPAYHLGRFLDSHEIDQETFEAELSGVLELARRARTRLRGTSAFMYRDDPAEGRGSVVPPATVADA